MAWFRVEQDERAGFNCVQIEEPEPKCLQWRPQQYDWNDGSRSCFVSVWAPWGWLAKAIGVIAIRKSGLTGRRWK